MEKPFKTLNDEVQKGKGSSNLDIKNSKKCAVISDNYEGS